MASKSENPFQLLTDIAQKSIQYSAGLPEQDEAVELWNGIGFTIANSFFVGEMSYDFHFATFTMVFPSAGFIDYVDVVGGNRKEKSDSSQSLRPKS